MVFISCHFFFPSPKLYLIIFVFRLSVACIITQRVWPCILWCVLRFRKPVLCFMSQTQWYVNNGKCGVCGDPWSQPSPRDNEAGGRYGKGIITRTYTPGQVIQTLQAPEQLDGHTSITSVLQTWTGYTNIPNALYTHRGNTNMAKNYILGQVIWISQGQII